MSLLDAEPLDPVLIFSAPSEREAMKIAIDAEPVSPETTLAFPREEARKHMIENYPLFLSFSVSGYPRSRS